MTDTPPTDERLDELTAIAARAAEHPFYVSDCEGSLQVWREKALTHVRRDADGVIDMYSFPSTYKVTDQVIELDLSTWDPGEDETDDQQRQDINDLVEARAALGALLAEVRRQRAELASTEMLAPQQCPAGLHADWLVDSEYAHACPWCQIDRLRTDAAAELMPVWEAVYEPGNVSDYLIGYSNSEAGAKGAAEAWMRSESEVTGRQEWVPWGDVTPMPDGYDRWLELGQQHDDGIDTGSGIVVRRRKEPAPAPPAASHGPAGDRDGETGTEDAAGREGDSGAELGTAATDTLPAWLHQRYAVNGPTSWERLDDGQRAYWEHQARAVRRAVDRGGFKDGVTSPAEETAR